MKRFSNYIIVLAVLIETVVFAALAPQFLSLDNFVNIAISIAVTENTEKIQNKMDDIYKINSFSLPHHRRKFATEIFFKTLCSLCLCGELFLK